MISRQRTKKRKLVWLCLLTGLSAILVILRSLHQQLSVRDYLRLAVSGGALFTQQRRELCYHQINAEHVVCAAQFRDLNPLHQRLAPAQPASTTLQ